MKKLRSRFWNERRYAAFTIGSIGSADSLYVRDAIPILIEYASQPETVRNELEASARKDTNVSVELTSARMLGVDPSGWLRDACIDAIGMIGKTSPDSVNQAIPLLEKLSKDESFPYTVKKAVRALGEIEGNR